MGTGLSYQGARYYDPATGRFLSQDPVFLNTSFNLEDPQSLNAYSYARNNPLIYVDPDGRAWVLASYLQAAKGYAVGFGQGAGRVAGGIVGTVAHPVQSWNQIGDFYARGGQLTGELVRDLRSDPSQVVSQIKDGAGLLYNDFESKSAYEQGRTIGNVFGQVDASIAIGAAADKALSGLSGSSKAQYSYSNHALQRMQERGVSQDQVQGILGTSKSFDYFHDNAWKNGYYDASAKIFVGQAKDSGTITTVINNVESGYVKNLKLKKP